MRRSPPALFLFFIPLKESTLFLIYQLLLFYFPVFNLEGSYFIHLHTFMFSATVKSMESATSCTGYKEPPWKFRGSALYQLHLVKSEVARALVPNEFRLVEAFGYTLGGFFLASYEDSPAGVFDELVVIAGLVWNPPTSCAWASRVLVSSKEACLHGRKVVGLPSHVARFSKSPGKIVQNGVTERHKEDKANSFLRRIGVASETSSPCIQTGTRVTQLSGTSRDIFSIGLINTVAVPQESSKRWMGPPISMSLPSFSGRTKDNPRLLKYSCQMACRVRLVKPVRVTTPNPAAVEKEAEQVEPETDAASHLSLLIMLSKPVLALEFNCMNMNVEAPLVMAE